ncbi:hypothetical protein [Dryocola clanedunensis]|uniref:hypothetical protein n=1 Tax=Cedecea sulfonylureivorans TaxID=3051154 RepID=UPI0019259AB7|nr:hypothetical protein [Cedecea sulfonylureivorans]
MNTPVSILEAINAEIIENTSLLELIYSQTNGEQTTDCAIACLLRSLYKTQEKIETYIDDLDKNN